jgi:hypothetical protein
MGSELKLGEPAASAVRGSEPPNPASDYYNIIFVCSVDRAS